MSLVLLIELQSGERESKGSLVWCGIVSHWGLWSVLNEFSAYLLCLSAHHKWQNCSSSVQDFLGQAHFSLGEVVGSLGSRSEKALGWVGLSVTRILIGNYQNSFINREPVKYVSHNMLQIQSSTCGRRILAGVKALKTLGNYNNLQCNVWRYL